MTSAGINDFSVNASCPTCGRDKLNLVSMPKGAAHFAALKCGGCERWLRWQEKPENQQKLQQQETVNHLLKSPQLTQWEQTFLEGLKGKKLSPKQQEVLGRIQTRVGGGV